MGHVFACLLWIVVIHLPWAWGMPSSSPSCLPQRQLRELMKKGIAGMLNVIKASLLGSALLLLEGCANLQSYQTPCVQGHVCECVQYTTVNRSWVDCGSYGRVSLPRPLTRATK
jgi:hypothetical protein